MQASELPDFPDADSSASGLHFNILLNIVLNNFFACDPFCQCFCWRSCICCTSFVQVQHHKIGDLERRLADLQSKLCESERGKVEAEDRVKELNEELESNAREPSRTPPAPGTTVSL